MSLVCVVVVVIVVVVAKVVVAAVVAIAVVVDVHVDVDVGVAVAVVVVVVSCQLSVVGCRLCVVCCAVSVVRCLFSVVCFLLFFVVCCSLLDVCCWLSVVCCLLLVVSCLTWRTHAPRRCPHVGVSRTTSANQANGPANQMDGGQCHTSTPENTGCAALFRPSPSRLKLVSGPIDSSPLGSKASRFTTTRLHIRQAVQHLESSRDHIQTLPLPPPNSKGLLWLLWLFRSLWSLYQLRARAYSCNAACKTWRRGNVCFLNQPSANPVGCGTVCFQRSHGCDDQVGMRCQPTVRQRTRVRASKAV